MLDPSSDEIRKWGNSIVEWMADYLGGIGDRKLYRQMSSREIQARLDPAGDVQDQGIVSRTDLGDEAVVDEDLDVVAGGAAPVEPADQEQLVGAGGFADARRAS